MESFYVFSKSSFLVCSPITIQSPVDFWKYINQNFIELYMIECLNHEWESTSLKNMNWAFVIKNYYRLWI